MTIPEFLVKLRTKTSTLRVRWKEQELQFDERRFVLRTIVSQPKRQQCPIAFVADGMDTQALSTGTSLGLSFTDIMKIVSAADNLPGCDATLSLELRHAVGLQA